MAEADLPQFPASRNRPPRRHGHTTKTKLSPTYVSWAGMLQRCTNPKAPKYPLYGGRGITVAPEWRDFMKFLGDMGERPKGTTLDRIDNNGDYTPKNCRWATPKMQQNNNSVTVFVTYMGERLCLSDLSARLGVKKSTLKYRIEAGWPEGDWGWGPWAGHKH